MKISVCMATYNGENYVKEQLTSILSQLSPNDEIIISDDGSTDNTIQIISNFNDNRIQIHHSGKKSVVKNFENALVKAKGDIIILSDQDDIWKEDKVNKVVLALDKNICVFSNAAVFKNIPNESLHLLYPKGNHIGFWNNLIKNKYIGATMAFKSSLLEIVLPFPNNIPMHDMWIGLLAELKGNTKYIDEPLIFYRRHGNNVSTTGKKSTNSTFVMIKIRFSILKLLAKRIMVKFITKNK